MQHNSGLPGVAITILHEVGIIIPETDGYLGEFTSGGFILRVDIVDSARQLHVFTAQMVKGVDARSHEVREQKVLLKKRDRRNNPLFGSLLTHSSYETRMGIKYSEQYQCAMVMYPQNHMVLVELGEAGSFTFWEIGIISQAGKFFLVIQDKYQDRCYRDGYTVVCPAFNNAQRQWPSLVGVLQELLGGQVDNLLPVRRYAPELPLTESLPEGEGEVLYWDGAKHAGVGLVRTNQGPVGVYWSAIKKTPYQRLAALQKGQRVKIGGVDTIPDSPYSYQMTAHDVMPVEL